MVFLRNATIPFLLALLVVAPQSKASDVFKDLALAVEIPIELQNDKTFRARDPGENINNLFATVEPVLTLTLFKGVSIETGLVLEPVKDPPGDGRDRFFNSHGLFVEVLSLNIEHGGFKFVGGKFTPNFGIAWEATPGIYGTDLAEEYELAERLGFGGSFTLNHADLGETTIGGSIFVLDRSWLAESAITRRPRPRRADGGPSNTGGLSSFVISLDGAKIKALPGVRYHFAYAHQRSGLDGEATEHSFVVGLELEREIAKDLTIRPIVEFVYQRNAASIGGQRRVYVTAGTEIGWKSWTAALAFTHRHTDVPGGPSERLGQFQVSAGYTFKNGTAVEIGWKRVFGSGTRAHVVGVLLTHTFSLDLKR
jgi:hypothetical protein